MSAWQTIETAPEGVVVNTKIDDERGARNETTLKRMGRLWWVPSGEMYVYYDPTHWRPFGALPTPREKDKDDGR